MTFVGKILVIVIMAFALLFLGISTVVFSTAVNWKTETAKQKKLVSDIQAKNNDLTTAIDAAKKDLERAKSDHDAAAKQADAKVKALQDEVAKNQTERDAARATLEVNQQSAKTALALAEQRLSETTLLRQQKSAVEQQANEYKLQQTELNDKIRELERQTKTLDENNKDLRDRVARYSTLLRKNGLSDDISVVRGLESPPPVKGEVRRIDAQNRRLEISIGSDDGLVPGHELYLYRTFPRSEYLGRVLIQSVDPDQAVAKVIGNTVSGKKIQEGDIVSSTIPRPRG